MSIINFSAALKQNRVTQINSALGANATLNIYAGNPPPGPDSSPIGTLLATLTCGSSAFGTVFLGVGSVVITAGGSGFTAGTYALAFSGGTGSGAAGTYTCSGGAVTSVTVTNTGSYTVAPSVSFPSGGGTGAAGAATLTGVLTANAITTANASSTGTAGYARLATSGGAGIVDLDVGTSGASVTINTTSIVAGGPVSCTSAVILES